MVDIFNHDRSIRFEEKEHRYFHVESGNELISTSKVLETVKTPFDREGISMMMAKGDPVKQAEILAEWDAKKDSSINRGNWIHDNLESYALRGNIDDKLKGVAEKIKPILANSHRFFPEAVVYSLKYGTAGQSDLVIQRQRSDNSLFDFYDYKTNESKGIEFDSIGRKKEKPNHYNRFLLSPLSHFEDCNYTHYSMQLSIYAYMAQSTWGINIGRLAIIFIDNDLNTYIIPVPYMKFEAMALLEHHKNLKPLPSKPATKEVEISSNNDDDW
jgi:hypothetical protein